MTAWVEASIARVRDLEQHRVTSRMALERLRSELADKEEAINALEQHRWLPQPGRFEMREGRSASG